MPCSPAKARLLLKEKKASVKRHTPFTIQLTIATGEAKQPVTLGVDSGYKHIGLSATTEKAELYASQVELRQDITDLLSARLALRRSRRSRKTRYRAPRFNNRVASKRKGWLAPSVENRIAAHMSRVEAVMRVLPVTAITVETAAFDTQLLKNPDIAGAAYQQGEQLGFWNVREYVLSGTDTFVSTAAGSPKIRYSMFTTLRADGPGAMRRTISSRCARPVTRLSIEGKSNSKSGEESRSKQKPSWASCVGRSLSV